MSELTEKDYRKLYCEHYLKKFDLHRNTVADFLEVPVSKIRDFIQGKIWDHDIAEKGFGYRVPDMNEVNEKLRYCEVFRKYNSHTKDSIANKHDISVEDLTLFEKGVIENKDLEEFYKINNEVFA